MFPPRTGASYHVFTVLFSSHIQLFLWNHWGSWQKDNLTLLLIPFLPTTPPTPASTFSSWQLHRKQYGHLRLWSTGSWFQYMVWEKDLNIYHLLREPSFPMFSDLATLVENQLTTNVKGFSGCSALFHWPRGSLLCWCHTVLITVALQKVLKSGSVLPPTLFFFFNLWLFWVLWLSIWILGTDCQFLQRSLLGIW